MTEPSPPSAGRHGWTAVALVFVAVVFAAGGVAVDRLVHARPDWYQSRTPSDLPSSPENDLVKYGWRLVADTPRFIGASALDPAMRYAGNDLACTNCHLNAGLQPFAAPFVSTYASYPLMSNHEVVTLADRINGCMTRSMNGRAIPEDGREMQAFIAYIRYLGEGSTRGVRVAGMGLLPLDEPAEAPSAERGKAVYEANCKGCHGGIGLGNPNTPPGVGWSVPPLWGPGSFNAKAGMADIRMAAAFVRANMPRGITYTDPKLSVQEAWDVAAYVESNKRPAESGTTAEAATFP